MSLAATVSAMASAGCTAQQIAAVVEAHEAVATARQAEKRAKDAERKRRQRHAMSRDVTRTEQDGGGHAGQALPSPDVPPFPSPTPPSHNPPLPPSKSTLDAGESALDGEVIPPSPSPSAPEVKARASPAKRGSHLPADWKPNAEEIEIARTEGIPDDQIPRVAAEFRDYWSDIPGERGRKLSWSGTWRNNCRKVADRFVRSRQAETRGNGRAGGGILGSYQRAAAFVQASNHVPLERSDILDL